MNNQRHSIVSLIAVILVMTCVVSLCFIPSPYAAENEETTVVGTDSFVSDETLEDDTFMSDETAEEEGSFIAHEEDDLAEVGASHRSADYSGLPSTSAFSLTTGVSEILLDTKTAYLDIYEQRQLSVMDAYSNSVNGRVEFTSSNASVVSVSSTGMMTAKKNGSATVSAKDGLTGKTQKCDVYVGNEYAPTEAPKPAPTDEPTEPPEPTQAPTQKPTQKPTQAPTQAPTQKPTQKPTQAPTQAPTAAPVAETLKLNASSATVYKGNYYHVVATSNVSVNFTSSNTSIATVASNGVVTTKATGTVTITAKTSTKSATSKMNVTYGRRVNISHSKASVYRYKTFLMTSSSSGVSWKSSDTSVATVSKGYVTGVKAGTAVITAYTSSGAATCLMTVEPSRSVRFAYTSPNCAAKNQTVTLVCITDTMRTGVRFEVTVGSTVKYVNATSKTKDGDTYVWKGTTSFSSAGTYKVKAYSQFNGGTDWYSNEEGDTTAFVADSTNMTTTTCTKRRASDSLIKLIATFEGFISSVYDDPLTGDPTLGYGILVYPGQQFYNSLTKNEAYAMLVQAVNNDGYATAVNNFLINNNVKFNQQQFDALVCFVYNVGSGPLSTDNELKSAILDCWDGSGSSTKSYYINDSDVNFRTGPGTGYSIITALSYGTSVTILSTSNSQWYYVQLSNGTKGYVYSEYISSTSSGGGKRDLNYIKKQNFINKFCQYHHAGGCIWGLLYRRGDETEMFFYGDYNADYGNYRYPITFKCSRNASFHT